MAMSNPPHPGRSIRENCLDPLGLNVTEAAKVLGVAVRRQTSPDHCGCVARETSRRCAAWCGVL